MSQDIVSTYFERLLLESSHQLCRKRLIEFYGYIIEDSLLLSRPIGFRNPTPLEIFLTTQAELIASDKFLRDITTLQFACGSVDSDLFSDNSNVWIWPQAGSPKQISPYGSKRIACLLNLDVDRSTGDLELN